MPDAFAASANGTSFLMAEAGMVDAFSEIFISYTLCTRLRMRKLTLTNIVKLFAKFAPQKPKKRL